MARTFQNEQALASAPIGPLMLRLAAPAVAAQLINVLYNIVDRIYIGHIAVVGKTALTGVGVTFPILTLISAFSAFAGMGGAPLASIRLGAGDRKGAEAILGSAVSMLVTMALVLTVGFSLFQRPLLLAFGASADTIGYATDYLTIYLLGTIFVQLSLGLNTFISAQGKAMPAMCSVLIGAVLNILLDPLFIFVFRMGVKGAALATILSQAVSAVWVVGFLCSDRSGLHICREHLGFRPRVMGKIAALGVAPFIMQSTESLVTVVLNVGAQKYGGDLYVASITILQSVMQIIVMPSHGITTGVQPIMSYNYGAKNYARVRAVFHRLLAVTMTVTTAAFLLVALFPAAVALMFNDDPELVALVGRVMPLFFGGVWAFGAQVACQSTFMALGQAKTSLFLALLRKIIPNEVRIACFIVVIAGFVTCVDLLLKAFVPALSNSLGVFIPLIVVNCIILGRAEGFASKNGIGASAVDGICQGVGYTLVLIVMCVVRELLGSGKFGGGLLGGASKSGGVAAGEHPQQRPSVRRLHDGLQRPRIAFQLLHHVLFVHDRPPYHILTGSLYVRGRKKVPVGQAGRHFRDIPQS